MIKKILLIDSGFLVDRKLKKLVKKQGYNSIFDIGARIDEKIIKFIEGKINTHKSKDYEYYGKTYHNLTITIGKVDISKKWTIIMDYEFYGENIVYLEEVDNQLNFYKTETLEN